MVLAVELADDNAIDAEPAQLAFVHERSTSKYLPRPLLKGCYRMSSCHEPIIPQRYHSRNSLSQHS